MIQPVALTPPRPDSPHLADCPHCGRQWLSRLALFCPLCGFSLQAHRRAARRRSDAHFLCNALAILSAAPLAISAVVATLGFQVSQQAWMSSGLYAILAVITWGAAFAMRERRSPEQCQSDRKTTGDGKGEDA